MNKLKLFSLLFGASIFGSITILPFVFLVQGSLLQSFKISFVTFTVLHIVQSAVLFAVAIFFGLLLAKRAELKIPILEAWIHKKPKKIIQDMVVLMLAFAVPLGFLAGFLILVADSTLPLLVQNSLGVSVGPVSFSFNQQGFSPNPIGVTFVTPEPWKGFLAAFYGAINEEILMRLFAMSLLTWVFSFAVKRRGGKVSSFVMWTAITGAALLFGVGHLPFTATLTAITPYIILRALLLNGIAGIIFGWLFWKKGLEAAMVAHFTADIFLFVILPLIQ
jgi:hypothetical protein